MVHNPPSSLNFLKTKSKWYVYVTIPPELRPAFKGQAQLRRSTGTSDKTIAKAREHGIAAEIYAELDKARTELNPLRNALEALSDALGAGKPTYTPEAYKDPETLAAILEEARGRVTALRYGPEPADFEEAVYITKAQEKAGPLLEQVEAELEVASGTAPSREKLSEVAKDFLSSHTFTKAKTKDAAAKAIGHFIEFSGDLVVSKIVKKNAYDFASGHSALLAGKTIVNRVSYVSQCLTYAERKGIITSNPFVGLRLEGYGRSQESYTPLDRKQLEALFKLTMPDEDRKLLSILIATGMRLDEAALLTWEDVKDEGGIPYFDLTVKGKKLKNTGSARKVPIVPHLLKVLGTKGTGRLFSYKTDKDGKAQSAASKALMRHIKKVRGTDTSKVVHSLRGSFKDMLRDVGVSKETNDFLTGHGSGDVAGGYGSGPSLKVRYDALCKVKHPWLA
jgi:integrase